MTRIGGADHVLLLLSEKLQSARRRKAAGSERSVATTNASPRDRLAALAALSDLPEREFRRAVVRGLLAEQLGEDLVLDSAFEAAALEVSRILEDTPETRELIERAAAQLLGSA